MVKESSEIETNVDNQLERKKGEKKNKLPCKELPELMSNDVKIDVPDKNIGITTNTDTNMEICLVPVKPALSGAEVNEHELRTVNNKISSELCSENEPTEVESIKITQMYDYDNNNKKHNPEQKIDDPSVLDYGMETGKKNEHLIKRKNTGSVKNDLIHFNNEVDVELEFQIIKTDDGSKKPFASNKEITTDSCIKELELTGATHDNFLTNSAGSSQIIVPPASELVQSANSIQNTRTSESSRRIIEESAIDVKDAIADFNMERTGHSDDYAAAHTSVEVNDEENDGQDDADGEMHNAPFDLQYSETSNNEKPVLYTINEIKSIKNVNPHVGDTNQFSESTDTGPLLDTEDETITEDKKMNAPAVEMVAISNNSAEQTDIQSNQIPNKTKTITENQIINVPPDLAVTATDISIEDQVCDIPNIQSIDSTIIGNQVINMPSGIEKTRLPNIITDDCVPLSGDVKDIKTIVNHTNNIAKEQMICEPSSVEIKNPMYTAQYGSKNTKSDIENVADQMIQVPSIEMKSISVVADDQILGSTHTAVQDIPITNKDTSSMPSLIAMINLFDIAKPRVLDPTDTDVKGFQISDNVTNTSAEQQMNAPSGLEMASLPEVVTDAKNEISKACDTDVRFIQGATLETKHISNDQIITDYTDNIHMEKISSSVPNVDAEEQRMSTCDIVDQSSSLQKIDVTKKCDPDIPTEDNVDQSINLQPTNMCDKEIAIEGNEGQSSNYQQRVATKISDLEIPTEDNEDHSSYNCQQIDTTKMCDHEVQAQDNDDQCSNPKPMKRHVQDMPVEDNESQLSNLQQIDATKKFDQEISTESHKDHYGNLQQIDASESCGQEMPIENNQGQSGDHQKIDVTKSCDQEMPVEDNQDNVNELQQIEAEMLEITNSQICQMELEYSLDDLGYDLLWFSYLHTLTNLHTGALTCIHIHTHTCTWITQAAASSQIYKKIV
ncbi:uncharacterized protein LOC117113068 isoform X2 [Anneissia japonica]|nr:uncharacterized protein LOC117113068 isoform X2 [Anneissia japonica]